jgi:hypothetical protein
MNFQKGPNLAIKLLVGIILIPVLAAWVFPCHEDCAKCQESDSHSNCCGGHLIPGLATPAMVFKVTLPGSLFPIFDQHFTQIVLHSDIYRPPRA